MAKAQANSANAAPANEAETDAGDESKRNKVSTFAYVDNAGETSKTVTPQSVGLVAKFANGESFRINIDELSTEMLTCATLQGLSIKLQRSFASTGGDVDKAVEEFETVLDNIRKGVWAVKGEGKGPRLSILAEAVEAVLVEAGQSVDDERRAAIIEKLKDEATREKTQKDAKVKAAYERIKAARAAERAAKAEKAAESADSEALAAF